MNQMISKGQMDTIETILKEVVPKGKIGVLIFSGDDDVEPEKLIESVKQSIGTGFLAGATGLQTFDLETADEEETV